MWIGLKMMSKQKDVLRNMENKKIKIIYGFVAVMMLLFQVSCSLKTPDENNYFLNNLAERETGQPISFPTQTNPQPSGTSEHEPTPSPTFSPINYPDDLKVSGTIWVLNVGDEFTNIEKLDLNNHYHEKITYQIICKGFIPRRAVAICQDRTEDESQIVDLETGKSSMIPKISQNIEGSYLDNQFYVRVLLESNDITYQFINLDSLEDYFFSLKLESVVALPRISFDGNYIAFIQGDSALNYRVMLHDTISDTNTQISGENQYISPNYLWSPMNTHLVYGATNYVTEFAGPTNQYYLFSLESGDSKLLYEAPDDQDLFYIGFTPDGEFIAIGRTDKRLCILGINQEFEECYSIFPISATWSPDSQYLAFYSLEGETPWIGVLDMDSGQLFSLFESQDLGESIYLNWVKD